MDHCRESTERTPAEEALRESNRKLAEVQRIAHLGYWERDLDGDRITWSDETYRIFGLRPQERTLSFEGLRELIHPEDWPAVARAVGEAVRGGPHCDIEYRLVRPDGETRIVHSRGEVIWDDSGRPRRMVGTVQDITERKQAENALRESHDLLNAVAEGTDVAFYVKDLQGRYLHINPVGARILGKPVEEILGKNDREVLPPETAQEIMERDRAVMSTGERRTFEDTLSVAGLVRTFLSTKAPHRDPHGRVIGLIGISRDITERKQADEALRESEQRYREVFKCASDCIFLIDVTPDLCFKIKELNPTDERTLGYSTAEVADKLIEDCLTPELAAAVGASYRRCVEAGTTINYETDLDLRIGRRSFQTSLIPVRDQGGRIHRLIGVARDVTERRRTEEQLRTWLREKDVLLKEIHHRVKNNLQLISSMLSLQAGRIRDPAVAAIFTESQSRLRAMALVHENLYRSRDLGSVRVAGHIEALCAYLYRSYSVDPEQIGLDLQIPDVMLDLDRSIRCGLIINELVSNAIKHAFPGGRTGRVSVRLDAMPDGCYSLVIQDDGVGLPRGLTPGNSESLGLQLVSDLSEQLGGILTVNREGGTTFTLRFPGDDGHIHDAGQNPHH